MKKIVALLLFLIAACGVVFLIMYRSGNQAPKKTPATFEECVAAGHPVMESYPRQCSGPGGRVFVETVVEER